jgi:hypothetical protein
MNLDNELPAPAAPRKRHSWVKLRLHVYICALCGCGYRNHQQPNGRWVRTYYLPSGQDIALTKTPACERGPRGEAALRKYADAL